jgi:hypothetical protein
MACEISTTAAPTCSTVKIARGTLVAGCDPWDCIAEIRGRVVDGVAELTGGGADNVGSGGGRRESEG